MAWTQEIFRQRRPPEVSGCLAKNASAESPGDCGRGRAFDFGCGCSLIPGHSGSERLLRAEHSCTDSAERFGKDF